MICYVFDLDGVVTNIEKKKITNAKLLEYFSTFLQNNDMITINTGRSLSFIRDEVFTPLFDYLQQRTLSESLLNNFFAVGEKGNAWIEDEKDYYDLSTAVPSNFAEKVRSIVEMDFKSSMFFDITKKTMISLEMTTGMPIEQFAPDRDRIIPILEEMLKTHGLESAYKLDPNVSAVDIQHKSAGKAKGIERILAWLSKNNYEAEKYIAFGDSPADIDMGNALQAAGKQFEFVFVGSPDLVANSHPFPITFTKEKYDKGVVEFLT